MRELRNSGRQTYRMIILQPCRRSSLRARFRRICRVRLASHEGRYSLGSHDSGSYTENPADGAIPKLGKGSLEVLPRMSVHVFGGSTHTTRKYFASLVSTWW